MTAYQRLAEAATGIWHNLRSEGGTRALPLSLPEIFLSNHLIHVTDEH